MSYIYNIDDILTSRKVNIIHANLRNVMAIITFPLKEGNLKEDRLKDWWSKNVSIYLFIRDNEREKISSEM